ncbi:MAG TPA: hypothetical protein VF332_00930 [Vicinamibacterales bacterium]
MKTLDRPSRSILPAGPPRMVRAAADVRSEYMSARLIAANIEHRLRRSVLRRDPGYVAPEIDYVLCDGSPHTVHVRDSDVRYLDRVPREQAIEHVDLIHRARRDDRAAGSELDRRTEGLWRAISARFAGQALVENALVIPYTASGTFSEEQISHKGAILIDLSRRGFATADFNLLSADAFRLSPRELDSAVRDVVRNLEVLTGRRLGDPANPLLIAMRSAVSEYIPGFMPTYLNVGLTPDVLPGLPARYGLDGAARIRLNSRKTILEALDPEAYAPLESDLHPNLTRAQAETLVCHVEELIARRAPALLTDAFAQIRFFLDRAYRYYTDHLDVLRNFMRLETHYPAVIFQRMVCSVIDDRSYAGILYSRDPSTGKGVFLQYATAVFGEDLMTGRLVPREGHFSRRDEAKRHFPAVYHFWDRLFQLEDIFRGPVMVEFTGVHGTFTILQVNAAELTGSAMLTAVMDLHRDGRITSERVREVIKPYHVRQIESDAIDPASISSLEPFAHGVAVLPRSVVTGRLSFSAAADALPGHSEPSRAILAKDRFTPQDAMEMQRVCGICSLSPAAIHVVTTAQNLGIPALLNLEADGVRIDTAGRRLVNAAGREIREGDWVTISSRHRTLYAGRAMFAPARLLRFMAGEAVQLTASERPRFERLADCYREYRRILESVDASGFESVEDLGHAIRYGELRGDPVRAREFVNRCFDARAEGLVRRLLETTLGMHLVNLTAFTLLTDDRKVRLFRMAAAACTHRGLSGYHAGAFVIGSLLDPRAPVAFWERFHPNEIAFLINEWVQYQKYLEVLEALGEKRVARAREVILSGGLGDLPGLAATIAGFAPLKLSRIDLGEVRRAVPTGADSQTIEVIDLLRRPYRAFFDFDNEQSVGRLRELCEAEGLPLPSPDEC